MTFKSFEQLDPQIAKGFEDIEISITALRAVRRDAVRGFDGEKLMPKVCWKIECYLQSLIYRTVALCDASKTCWNASNFLAAAVLARSVLEMAAVAFRFFRDVEEGVRAKDLSAIDGAVTKMIFATRHPRLTPILPPATNILSLIDRLDSDFFKDKESGAVRFAYDGLCEFAHPNWGGTTNMFGKLNYDERTTYFSEDNVVRNHVAAQIRSGLGSAIIVQWCHGKVRELLPEVAEISEAARAKPDP